MSRNYKFFNFYVPPATSWRERGNTFVIGVGEKKVTFYNGSKSLLTIKLSDFTKMARYVVPVVSKKMPATPISNTTSLNNNIKHPKIKYNEDFFFFYVIIP